MADGPPYTSEECRQCESRMRGLLQSFETACFEQANATRHTNDHHIRERASDRKEIERLRRRIAELEHALNT